MSVLTQILLPLALLAPASIDGGFLGVHLAQDVPTVIDVIPDTAAAKSDIKAGDKFTAVDGKETPTTQAFMKIVGGHSVGDRVRFDIDRSGHELTLYIVLGKRPADTEEQMGEEESQPTPLAPSTRHGGAVAAPAAPAAGRAFLGVQLDEDCGVSGVVENGPAMKAGIREGDRITRLGRAGDLETADDLRAVLGEMKPGQTVSVRVRRGDATETMSVTLGTKPASEDEAEEHEAAEEKAAAAPKAEKAQKAENKAHAEKAAAEKSKVEKQAHAEKVAAEKAHGEGGEAAAGAVRARSQGGGESENRDAEVSKLRDELRELRDEIRELKALVKKLNK